MLRRKISAIEISELSDIRNPDKINKVEAMHLNRLFRLAKESFSFFIGESNIPLTD